MKCPRRLPTSKSASKLTRAHVRPNKITSSFSVARSNYNESVSSVQIHDDLLQSQSINE
jgi:hypothetical protein